MKKLLLSVPVAKSFGRWRWLSARSSVISLSRSFWAVSLPRCSGLSIFTATSLPSNVAKKTLQKAPHLGHVGLQAGVRRIAGAAWDERGCTM